MNLTRYTILSLVTLSSASLATPSSLAKRDPSFLRGLFKKALEHIKDPLPSDTNGRFFNQGTPVPITDALRSRLTLAANLAATTYCPSVQSKSWSCGPPCDAVPQTQLLYAAGDGDLNPHQFVAWLPEEQAVAVLTEGSNFAKILSVLNDFVFLPLPPSSAVSTALGSGSNSKATVHGGFLNAHERAYPALLTEVKKALVSNPQATKVIVVGHSLGAAIALLNMLALRHDLDNSLKFEHYGFGSPRVFNAAGAAQLNAFVSRVDSNVIYRHIHAANDPIVHLGPLLLGFQHAANEVFLPDTASQTALDCPGIENVECSLGRKIFAFADHTGPYFGRLIGRGEFSQCSK